MLGARSREKNMSVQPRDSGFQISHGGWNRRPSSASSSSQLLLQSFSHLPSAAKTTHDYGYRGYPLLELRYCIHCRRRRSIDITVPPVEEIRGESAGPIALSLSNFRRLRMQSEATTTAITLLEPLLSVQQGSISFASTACELTKV